MKRILILGGSHADIPLIKAAKELGFYVITSGNLASDVGHVEADEYCAADFSDPKAILELAKQLKIDAICPCCNDFAAISCAYVAENLGLAGHDSYESSLLLHHKDSYRRFALDNDIPTPNAVGFSDVESALVGITELNYPLIIKPVDLSGGKGISKASNLTEACSALEAAFTISKSQRVVVEEFLEGANHGFSAFLRDGKIVFHFTDNEHYYLNKYMVSGASCPSSISANVIDDLIVQSEKIAQILQLKNGIFHVQFILNNGKPTIIEICRRPPGDLYIELVKIATGVDYPSYIVRAFAGMDCEDIRHTTNNGFYLRHCIMTNSAGMIDGVTFDPSLKQNVMEGLTWWKKADQITDFLTEKVGIVFMKFSSEKEMNQKVSNIQNLIQVNIIRSGQER